MQKRPLTCVRRGYHSLVRMDFVLILTQIYKHMLPLIRLASRLSPRSLTLLWTFCYLSHCKIQSYLRDGPPCACVIFRPKHRNDEKMEAEIYRHRGRAITKLRDRMADVSLQADDASILTVTSLTASEVCEAPNEQRSSSLSDHRSAVTWPQ